MSTVQLIKMYETTVINLLEIHILWEWIKNKYKRRGDGRIVVRRPGKTFKKIEFHARYEYQHSFIKIKVVPIFIQPKTKLKTFGKLW